MTQERAKFIIQEFEVWRKAGHIESFFRITSTRTGKSIHSYLVSKIFRPGDAIKIRPVRLKPRDWRDEAAFNGWLSEHNQTREAELSELDTD